MASDPLLHLTQRFAMYFIPVLIAILATGLARLYQRRSEGVAACRKLGLDPKSNIADEHAPHYDGAAQKDQAGKWTVKSLWTYPVKSCKGVELGKSNVTGLGMQYDRLFSFAHYTNRETSQEKPPNMGWSFLTQRQVPALTKVKTEIWVPDPSSEDYDEDHPNVLSQGVLVIKWPRFSAWPFLQRLLGHSIEMSVELPFDPTQDQIKRNGMEFTDMKIWKNQASALKLASTRDGSAQSASWIKDLLQYLDLECKRQNPPFISKAGHRNPGFTFDMTKPFALLRSDPSAPRQVFRNAPTKEVVGYQPIIGFQDAYPLHIMNLASVREVAKNLEPGSPLLSVRNYRPNMIIVGGDAYAEDEWKMINIGGATYYVSNRTSRCLLPNVDQDTGKKDAVEPNKTMMKLRKIDEGCPTSACLGMQMVPAVDGPKVVRVGDEVEVTEVGEHFYIK